MKVPNKAVIEITGSEYTHKILDSEGNVLWQSHHEMEGAGQPSCSTGDIFDSEVEEYFPDLATSIDDLSFGPFGVSSALCHLIE